MKNETIYVKACVALILTVVLWGFIAPSLISSATDIGVILGALVVLAVPLFDYWVYKSIRKTLNKNVEPVPTPAPTPAPTPSEPVVPVIKPPTPPKPRKTTTKKPKQTN